MFYIQDVKYQFISSLSTYLKTLICVQIWHSNMPHNKIAERKGHQGWMTLDGPHFIFPGGGTMFPDGAIQYIEKLGQYIPIGEGVLRTALDMGCGVKSRFPCFLGYLSW